MPKADAFSDTFATLRSLLKRHSKKPRSCFNFTTIDSELVKEPSLLTKAGIERYGKIELPWA